MLRRNSVNTCNAQALGVVPHLRAGPGVQGANSSYQSPCRGAQWSQPEQNQKSRNCFATALEGHVFARSFWAVPGLQPFLWLLCSQRLSAVASPRWSGAPGRVSSAPVAPGLLSCGTWDLPRPGIELVSPASVGGFLTTEPPGKPLAAALNAGVQGGKVQDRRPTCPQSPYLLDVWADSQAQRASKG